MSLSDDIQDTLKQGLSPFQKQLKEVLEYLISYVKNPIHAMRKLPNWDWNTLLIVFTAAAATCGVIAGVVSFRISQIFVGLIFFPISACAGAMILSAFLYYTFLFLFRVEMSLRLLFTIVTLALLPFFALYTFSSLLEPLNLIGFAATGFMLIVGLSEHSHIERKKIIQLVLGLYVFYFLFWGINLVRWQNEKQKLKVPVTPESYDQLKKELSN